MISLLKNVRYINNYILCMYNNDLRNFCEGMVFLVVNVVFSIYEVFKYLLNELIIGIDFLYILFF